MYTRIQRLSSFVSNQIAAGEVVERPASVLKELLENSLDAQATDIRVTVESGGKRLLQVTDNGVGIHPEDLALALDRHATSKIYHPADLAQITSLGFRGEALASIASVSRIQIISQHENEPARAVEMQGHDSSMQIKPAAHARGTTVQVKDLFFNTPARQKFLKSDRTEWLVIEDLLKCIAIANPQVSFSLYEGSRCVKRYPQVKEDLKTRIEQVLSKRFTQTALPIQSEITEFRLTGFLGDPLEARSSNDQAYFYVNGRAVKDKMLMHAMRLGYENKLFPGRFPSYVILLECPAHRVDVNVHPTKHEVRFEDARLVHDFVMQSVMKTFVDSSLPSEESHPANSLLPSGEGRVRGLDKEQSDLSSPPKLTLTNFSLPLEESHLANSPLPSGESRVRGLEQETAPNIKFAISPWGDVLSVINRELVLTQKENTLYAFDWQKNLKKLAEAKWKNFSGSVPRMPVLDNHVVSVLLPEEWVAQLLSCGFYLQSLGPSKTCIREFPSFLKGLPIKTISFRPQSVEDFQKQCVHEWAQAWQGTRAQAQQLLLDMHVLLGEKNIIYRTYTADQLL